MWSPWIPEGAHEGWVSAAQSVNQLNKYSLYWFLSPVIPLASLPPCFLGSPPMKPPGLRPRLKLYCWGESQLRKLSVSVYLWFLWKSVSILRKTNFGTQIQDECWDIFCPHLIVYLNLETYKLINIASFGYTFSKLCDIRLFPPVLEAGWLLYFSSFSATSHYCLGEELGTWGDVRDTQETQGVYPNSQLSVLVCAAWMSALLLKISSRFSRVLCPSLFWSRILALAGQLSRRKILASDQRTFFFSFRAKPTGPQQYQPPLWLHWPHAERAEPTGLCRQLLALPRPDLSPLEIFIVITLVFHHSQALGYVARSWTL